jgi:HEAT repeat protein
MKVLASSLPWLSALWLLILFVSPSWQADRVALWLSALVISADFLIALWILITQKRVAGTLVLLQLALFGMLQVQIFAALGPGHYLGPYDVHWGDWAELAAAHVLRAADLLDVLHNYGIDLQRITHHSVLAGVVLVALHLAVAVFVLTWLVQWAVRLRWRLANGGAPVLLEERRAAARITDARLSRFQKLMALICLPGIAACAMLQHWSLADCVLWPLDQLVRLLDVGDVMEVFRWRLHGVEFSFWAATLAILVRCWLGLCLARAWSALHVKVLGRRALRVLEDYVNDLASADEAVRLAAVQALAGLGPAARPAIPGLLQTVTDDSWSVGVAARLALARIGAATPEQVAELIRLLDEPNWAVRRGAVDALAELGAAAEDAVPALAAKLADADPALPARIERALGRISPYWPARPAAQAALPALAGKLAARDPKLRRAAAGALARFGPSAAPAVPALLLRLTDHDEYVRISVEAALDAIDPTWRREVFVLPAIELIR